MLAPWKREADAIFDDTLRLFRLHFDDVKAKAARGDETHCLARYIQELQKQYGLTDEQAIFTAGAMFGAGSDTTAVSRHPLLACRPSLTLCAGRHLDVHHDHDDAPGRASQGARRARPRRRPRAAARLYAPGRPAVRARRGGRDDALAHGDRRWTGTPLDRGRRAHGQRPRVCHPRGHERAGEPLGDPPRPRALP